MATAVEAGRECIVTRSDGFDPPRHEVDRDAMRRCAESLSEACRKALEVVVADPTAVRAAGRTLGLDKSLAMKLVRIAHASDAEEIFGVLPGPRGWGRILERVESRDDAGVVTSRLRSAVDDFQREASRRGLSRSHLVGWSTRAGSSIVSASDALQIRDSVTRSNAAIWGVAADAMLRTFVVVPGPGVGRHRLAVVTTVHGLHRTRPGPEWSVHRIAPSDRQEGDEAHDRDGDAVETIDCSDLCTHGGVAVSGEFRNRLGETYRTFRGDSTGPADRVDLVFAEAGPDTPAMRDSASEEHWELGTTILVPVSRVLIEVVVGGELPFRAVPRSWSVVLSSGRPLSSPSEALHRLPMTEAIEGPAPVEPGERLVPAVEGVSSQARTRHASAIERAMAFLGVEHRAAVRHRVDIANPMLASGIRLAWPWPSAEEA